VPLLDVSGSNRIYVLLDPDRKGRPDFTGEVLFRGGFLWLSISDRSGDFVRRVRAYHPERNIMKAVVSRGLPNPTTMPGLPRPSDTRRPRDRALRPAATDGWLELTPGQ
jgi:hypothetical protein